jgi:triosephosphate isomerase
MVKKTSRKNNPKIVVGNWKMNPLTAAEAKRIIGSVKKTAKKLSHTTIVICPPFPFMTHTLPRISLKSSEKSDVKTGAQNVFFEEQGAYTGEVSARQLVDIGVEYVIVGHSERRRIGATGFAGETDAVVAQKAVAAVEAGLTVILCVGETVRDTQGEYLDFLKNQIKMSLQGFSKKMVVGRRLIIGYEPLWAIGAKEAMTPTLVHEMTIFVKKVLADMYGQDEAFAVPILYGGSVNFRNAADIIRGGEVNGLLVGRESVNAPGFSELLRAVDEVK